MRWWRDWKPYRWVDVGVALEQSTNVNGKRDAIFFIYFTQYDEKKVRETQWHSNSLNIHPSSLLWSNHWIEMTGEVKAMLWSQCLSHLQYLKSRCLLLRIYRYATVLLWIIQSFSFLDCLSQWSECIHFLPLPPFRYLSQYLHVFISDVTVLVPVLKDNSHHAFAVYTSDSTKQRWPLILSAQTEKDMADWVCLERPPFRYKQHT